MDRSRTKQVCTIGPASADRIADLVAAGMDVARVNFSHGTDEEHRSYVHAVRASAHSARRSVAVMADLPGPKLRLGELAGGAVRLETGAVFALRATDSTPGDAAGAAVPNAILGTQLQVGDRVLLADGAVELRVAAIDGPDVTTEVVNGGLIRSRAGVNVPSERLGGDGLTDADRAAVPRALELRADLIAQSFVRSAADVRALRSLLPADGPRVVAKIETRAAIDNFDEICAAADGIMVARGDLGVDVPFEDVPLIQKDLIRRATAAGKFSIVATQMLESMTGAPRPTRAEASDVANAVLDGADAVMLSAETAIGAYAVEALQAMERICARAESVHGTIEGRDTGVGPAADQIVSAATYLASRGATEAIWCFTRSGRTAEMLSLHKPGLPIVAFTLSPIVARRLAVRRGIVPLVLPTGNRQAAATPLIERMDGAWRAQRGAAHHERVLLVTTSSQASGINRLELHRVAVSSPAVPAGQRHSGERREPPPASRSAAPSESAPAEEPVPEAAAVVEPVRETEPMPEPVPEAAAVVEPVRETEPMPEPVPEAPSEPEEVGIEPEEPAPA